MGERLQLLMKEYGLTSARFADVLEIQPSAISHLISGRNKPSFDLLSKIIVKYPELNPRWLILGEGGMFETSRDSVILNHPGESSGLFDFQQVPENRIETLNTEIFAPYDKENSQESRNDSIKPDLVIPGSGQIAKADIKSVIIFYKDGTFESFEHK